MTNTTLYASTDTSGSYYANPYSCDHAGFYFTDMASFTTGMKALNARGAEEVEIDYIDGDHAELFAVAGVHQGNISEWLELLDEVEDYQLPALFHLLDDQGETLAEALQHLDDAMVTEGTAEDYAHEYIEDSGMLDALPEQLRYYFDYEAFARDLKLNGDVTEFVYDGTTYTAQGGA